VARHRRRKRKADAGSVWWAGLFGGLIVGALGVGFIVTAHKLALAFIASLVAVSSGLAARKIRKPRTRRSR